MSRYDYQIASGWDQEANFDNVEDILPEYATHQSFFPKGRGNFDDGTLRIRADGQIYTTGFAGFNWPVDILTYAQWAYLQTNYCTGGTGYSGKVTVRTRLIGGTYANYNAIMILPKPPDEDKRWIAMRNVVIRFTRVEST